MKTLFQKGAKTILNVLPPLSVSIPLKTSADEGSTVYPEDIFCYFSIKTYTVGTHWNHLTANLLIWHFKSEVYVCLFVNNIKAVFLV